MATARSILKLDRHKLETTFDADNSVTHTTYRTDLAARQRKTPIQTKWTERKVIGSGGFGIVVLQEEERGELRAVKRIPKGMGNIDYSREVHLLSKVVDRPDLFVLFLGWYENRDFVFIGMEYIEHGDLGQYMKTPGSRSNAREISRQLLEGLAVLHERKICHRDLKPQNVLMASPYPIWVKIADFGVSKHDKSSAFHTRLGTQGYFAPEVLGLLQSEQRVYSSAVDMWALGCVVHEMLTAETPFLEGPRSLNTLLSGLESTVESGFRTMTALPLTDMDRLKGFCDGKTPLPVNSLQTCQASSTAIQFVRSLLVADPQYRPSANDMLRSPWVLEKGEEEGTGTGPIVGESCQSTGNASIVSLSSGIPFPPTIVRPATVVGEPHFAPPYHSTDIAPAAGGAPSYHHHQSFSAASGLAPRVPTTFNTQAAGTQYIPFSTVTSSSRDPRQPVNTHLTSDIDRFTSSRPAVLSLPQIYTDHDSGRYSETLNAEQFSDTNESPSTPTPYAPPGVPSRLPHVAQELRNRWALLSANSAPKALSSVIKDKVQKVVESISGDLVEISKITLEHNGRENTRRGQLAVEKEERSKQHSVRIQRMGNNNVYSAICQYRNEEFALEELQKDTLEKETEFEIYCSDVFDAVYDILQSVIWTLTDLSTEIINHDIPRIIVGRARWDIAEGAVTVSHVETQDLVDGLFALQHHIETGYDKMHKTITERDCRYRQNVVRRLYADGEIAKIDGWEEHFALSERKVVHEAAQDYLKRCQQLVEIVEITIERAVHAELNYSNDTAAAIHALINSYERSLMTRELIGGYNILEDVSNTLHKLSSASFGAKRMLNMGITVAALAEERVERNRTLRIESIIIEREKNHLQYNRDNYNRQVAWKQDFTILGERITALLKVMGVAFGSGMWILESKPSIDQVEGELWSQYEAPLSRE